MSVYWRRMSIVLSEQIQGEVHWVIARACIANVSGGTRNQLDWKGAVMA